MTEMPDTQNGARNTPDRTQKVKDLASLVGGLGLIGAGVAVAAGVGTHAYVNQEPSAMDSSAVYGLFALGTGAVGAGLYVLRKGRHFL